MFFGVILGSKWYFGVIWGRNSVIFKGIIYHNGFLKGNKKTSSLVEKKDFKDVGDERLELPTSCV